MKNQFKKKETKKRRFFITLRSAFSKKKTIK